MTAPESHGHAGTKTKLASKAIASFTADLSAIKLGIVKMQRPNTKAATLLFGFCHGFGLSSKILDYDIAPDGLLPNLLAFNVGVEIGQMLALAAILIVMGYWRRRDSFWQYAYSANTVMMAAGFVLIGYQFTGYAIS